MLKLKNIIIYTVVGLALILIYIFFIKKSPEETPLVSTSSSPIVSSTSTSNQDLRDTEDFLSLLLNVKNIKLDNTIFSDMAFLSLRDSSIVLTPDGTEGRVNPFAPIGSEGGALPANNPPVIQTTSTPPTNPTDKITP